jgi:hypothetical protein
MGGGGATAPIQGHALRIAKPHTGLRDDDDDDDDDNNNNNNNNGFSRMAT